MKMKTALTIAGSDSSGGAGIQADIKTMMANGVYAMSAITALTAQNTRGVWGTMETEPEFLGSQLDAVFTDIMPDAVKIGMIPNGEMVEIIADRLRKYHAKNIVVDPVMIASTGASLSREDTLTVMREKLFPLADVLTPNIPETEKLWGRAVGSFEEMEQAARKLGEEYGCAVLCKGGHMLSQNTKDRRAQSSDLLYHEGIYRWYEGQRIANPNTHGTGCTLSSAIASNLAKGDTLEMAVERAKAYVSGAIGAMLDLGKGSGPMNHGFFITGGFFR